MKLDSRHLNEWLEQDWEKALALAALVAALVGGALVFFLSGDGQEASESRSCPTRKSFLEKKSAFEFASGADFKVSDEALIAFGWRKFVPPPPPPPDPEGPKTVAVTPPPPPPPPANKVPVVSRLEASLDQADLAKKTVWVSGEGTDPDGRILIWAIEYGDGRRDAFNAPLPAQGVQHTYKKAGNYNVTLTCTDDKGAAGSKSVPVAVGGAKGTGGPVSVGGGEVAVTYTSNLEMGGRLKVFLKFDRGAAGGMEVKPLFQGETHLGFTVLKASPGEVVLKTADGRETTFRKGETKVQAVTAP